MAKSQKKHPRNNLRMLREAKGISMRELARKLQIDHSNLGYWERSGRPPKSDLLLQMAEILECSIEELLGVNRAKHK